MREKVAIGLAATLAGVACYLGGSALLLLDTAKITSAAELADVEQLNARFVNMKGYLDLAQASALARSILAVAAAIPVPALLRIGLGKQSVVNG